MVLKLLEHSERQFDATSVELSSHSVCSEEPSVERLAEPVAVFGLYHPVAYALIVIEFPGVDAIEGLNGVLSGLSGKILGMFFSFIVFCIFAL